MSGPFWDDFEKTTEEWFSYLVAHHESMVDDKRVLHFTICPSSWGSACVYVERVQQLYHKEMEHVVRGWVREEKEAGRLLVRENWLPFRHLVYHVNCYMGYRRLFTYQGYVFQLSVDVHDLENDCTDCLVEPEPEDIDIPHFAAMVYGKKGEVEEGWMSDKDWRKW